MESEDGKIKDTRKYILDTNVFNHVLDQKISLEELQGHELFSTHIQEDELKQTPSLQKRESLLSVFKRADTINIPTKTTVWGVSAWGRGEWSSGDGMYDAILERVRTLDRTSGKKKLPENQSRDALIAETAIKAGLILITNDKNLTIAARENGCQVVDRIGNYKNK